MRGKRGVAPASNEGTLRAFCYADRFTLSKSFAGRALFDDVSLQVNRGDRMDWLAQMELVNHLVWLLLGDVSPTRGRFAIEKNARSDFFRRKPPPLEMNRARAALAVHPTGAGAESDKEHEAAVAGVAQPGADAAYHNALTFF